MPVTVDGKSIRSQLRQFGENALLLARSKPVLPAEVVREAAIAAEAEESTPWMGSVMVIPAGVVIGLEGLADDISAYVEKFAAELAARTDSDVALGAARSQATPSWLSDSFPRDSVSAWMVHRLTDRLAAPWSVDEETTRKVAAAVSRELEPSEVTMATIDAELSLNYTGVSISEAAWELLRGNSLVSFLAGSRDPGRVREVSFWGPASVAVWLGRPSSGVLEEVAAGRRLLVATAESAVCGAVMTGRPTTFPDELPLVSGSHFHWWSRYWDRVVPDAYGLQVLTPGHLERVGDLSRWVTTRLEAGRYLVEARDLGAWFDGPAPDPGVQAAARADFAGIILSSALMGELEVPGYPQFRIDTAAAEGTLAGGRG
jgi:hypothetical protein